MTYSIKTTVLTAVAVLAVTSSAFAQATPSQQRTDEARRSGPCRDPWITLAIADTTAGGIPVGRGDEDQCNPKLYNDGNWSSYQELYRAVDQTLRKLSSVGVQFKFVNGQPAFVATDIQRMLAAGVIGQSGSALIGKGGAGIVAAGGGNIVAAGGGNIADRQVFSGETVTIPLPSGKKLFVQIR